MFRRLSPLAALALALAPPVLVTACGSGSGFVPADGRASADGGPADDSHVSDGFVQRPDIEVGPPIVISVATFNVRNMFDAVDDKTKADTVSSVAEVSAKLKQVGAALRKINADVVALQEIESRALLKRLNDEQLAELGYANLRLVEGNDVRGVDVGLLSRYPVPRAISHAHDVFKGVVDPATNYGFSRDCLEATIEPSPGRTLLLLVNHLRANDWQEPDESLRRRLAQARRVREIADATLGNHPNANLAVIGDLNDVPGSDALKLIVEGSVALSDVLEGTSSAERYTTLYQGKKEQIDHILVSPALKANIVAGSAAALHDSVFSSTSDHYPVIASFRIE